MDAVAAHEFGRLVARYRGQRNMSQERLAELAGMTGGYISQIESGKRGKRPSRDTVIRISQVLGAPLPEMLRAAGRLAPGDEMTPTDRLSFEEFVNTDPALTTTQKAALIGVYRSIVGRAGA